MLNLHFKHDSRPIDNDDLRSVIGEVARLMQSELGAEKDLALLLSKMVLRIHIEVAKNTPGNVTSEPATPSGLNREDVRHGDIIAHVAKVAGKLNDERVECDSAVLGQALRDELPLIAGRVSDESFAVLIGVCAALVNDAAQTMLADIMARTTVTKAKGKKGST